MFTLKKANDFHPNYPATKRNLETTVTSRYTIYNILFTVLFLEGKFHSFKVCTKNSAYGPILTPRKIMYLKASSDTKREPINYNCDITALLAPRQLPLGYNIL